MALSMRRNVMNVVRNYSDAEIKVREATSNDPWGPSSSLMAEIADMTYNTAAFSEIMTMIWKRINDHGKNWRHVYKALVLLDYLIKTGSERVAQQCKENIFAIQTLKDFQFIDRDVKDQGSNVREKSKQLVSLLKDDERLKSERAKALKAKERFQQATTGIGSDSQVVYGHGSKVPRQPTPESRARHTTPNTTSSVSNTEIEQARPQTAGEEELQLQLALSMSKEEAETERKKQESDAVRLEMALSESTKEVNGQSSGGPAKSSLVDLTAAAKSLKDPWGGVAPKDHHHHHQQPVDPFSPIKQEPASDPWSAPTSSVSQQSIADPWSSSASAVPAPVDPWSSPSNTTQVSSQTSAFDPFETPTKPAQTSTSSLDFFESLTATSSSTSQQPFDLTPMSNTLPTEPIYSQLMRSNNKSKAEDFLGGASDLVNLDSLVTPPPTQQQGGNPFLGVSTPYSQPAPNPKTLNQMKGISTPVLPAAGTTIMPPVNPSPMGGAGIMPGPYSTPMMQPGFGMQPNPGFGAGMGNPAVPMMSGGVGMTPQPSMGSNVGNQVSNNPFF